MEPPMPPAFGAAALLQTPEALVVPVKFVKIPPPWMLTVAPTSAAPEGLTAFTEIMPAVDSWILRVEVAPPLTVTVPLRARYPVALAVSVWLPLLTLDMVYTPLEFVETAMLFHFTVAPDSAMPFVILVMVPVTVPVEAAGFRAKLAVAVPPAARLTVCEAV